MPYPHDYQYYHDEVAVNMVADTTSLYDLFTRIIANDAPWHLKNLLDSGALTAIAVTARTLGGFTIAEVKEIFEDAKRDYIANLPPLHGYAAVYGSIDDSWWRVACEDGFSDDAHRRILSIAADYRADGYLAYVGRTDAEDFVSGRLRLGPPLRYDADRREWSAVTPEIPKIRKKVFLPDGSAASDGSTTITFNTATTTYVSGDLPQSTWAGEHVVTEDAPFTVSATRRMPARSRWVIDEAAPVIPPTLIPPRLDWWEDEPRVAEPEDTPMAIDDGPFLMRHDSGVAAPEYRPSWRYDHREEDYF